LPALLIWETDKRDRLLPRPWPPAEPGAAEPPLDFAAHLATISRTVAPRCGTASPRRPFLTVNEKRAAVGYGAVVGGSAMQH
jgi:hypothetical protein